MTPVRWSVVLLAILVLLVAPHVLYPRAGPVRDTVEEFPPPLAVETVERFPSMDLPRRVAVAQTVVLRVQLLASAPDDAPEVRSPDESVQRDHALKVAWPAGRDELPAVVDVSAPGFEFLGWSNTAPITLFRGRDSTAARFEMVPRGLPRRARVRADFLVLGRPAGSATIEVDVIDPRVSRPPAATLAPERETANDDAPQKVATRGRAAPMVFDADARPPDLTVVFRRARDRAGLYRVSVHTPHAVPGFPSAGSVEEAIDVGPGLPSFLNEQFRRVEQAAVRLAAAADDQRASARREASALLRGLGETLYRRFTTANVRAALAALSRRLGGRFETILVVTNDPVLPWELVCVPAPRGGGCRFLGASHAVGRWVVGDEALRAMPGTLAPSALAVLAPGYGATYPLRGADVEARTFERSYGARVIRSVDLGEVEQVLTADRPFVLHFCGHGDAIGHGPVFRSLIRLSEDVVLDATMLRGLTAGPELARSLVFPNACETGRAEGVLANFAEGLGPAFVDKGAGGVVGALWRVPDFRAAEVAERFYRLVLADDSRNPAEALRAVRHRFDVSGDPTWLAYVYYGDPRGRLRWRPSRRGERPPSSAGAATRQPNRRDRARHEEEEPLMLFENAHP